MNLGAGIPCAARRHLVCLALLLCGCIGSATATEQIPDTVVIGGQRHVMHAEPFGMLLEQPEHWQTFRKLLEAGAGRCSANWRGYRGDWEITDDRLYLKRLVSNACAESPPEIDLQDYFPGQQPPIPAEWFTGVLVVPQGEPGGNDHMGYSTQYPHYLLLDIRAGQVVAQKKLDHAQFQAWREAQRKASVPAQ